MPRYTPLTAVDEKIRDLAERKKVKEPVVSMYLPSDYVASSTAPKKSDSSDTGAQSTRRTPKPNR